MRKALSLLLTFLLVSCSSPEVAIQEETSQSDDFKLTLVENIEGIEPSEVLSFICELVMAKPSEATPYCADFGVAIWDIEWSSWQASGATGKGTYRANDCDPNCADGTIYSAPVDVKLKDLYSDGSRYFLRNLTFTSKENLPLTDSKNGTWDVAEFYIEVPDMRSDD